VLTAVLVLMVIGSGAFVWHATRRSRPNARALPHRQRGVGDIRTRDVVSHLGRDWLVEGVLQLEEGGRRRRLARLVDGSDERWLLADSDELALLARAEAEPPPLPPPDRLQLAGDSFHLVEAGGGRVARHGDVGSRSLERCRFWRYVGPGSRRAWLDEFRAAELLIGEAVPGALLELLPGS
jgi:hypothetical protein